MPTNFIQDMVENPHPIYAKYLHYWNFLLDSYEGGVDYTSADIPHGLAGSRGITDIQVFVDGQQLSEKESLYLFKHTKERKEDYNTRVLRSYYYNFCSPVIDIYTDHLFRNPVNDDFKNIEGVVEKRRDNIDRKQSSIIELRKELADKMQIYGNYYAIVDMPQFRGEVSLQDRINNDQFPFISLFSPQKVINWALDAFGRPFWVLLCETGDDNPDPYSFDKNKDNKAKYNYRLWTRNEWALFDNSYELIEEGQHKLGMVPIVPIYNKQSNKYRAFFGVSELADISFISRDIYNLCSELSQIIRDQTFSFLAIQGDPLSYGGDQSLGTGKGLIYPENANVPQYIAPSPESARVIMDQIENQIRKVYQLAKLDGASAHQAQQVQEQSGISKAFDFHETNSALSKKASNLNDAELKIWGLFAKWEGKGDFEGSVEYPDDFSVSSVNDDIKEALELIKLDIGKIAIKETNKAILQKKFPRLPEEELNVMIADMETTVDSSDNNNNNNGNGNGLNFRERFNLFRTANPSRSQQQPNQGGRNA